jgi:hypothetical protein
MQKGLALWNRKSQNTSSIAACWSEESKCWYQNFQRVVNPEVIAEIKQLDTAEIKKQKNVKVSPPHRSARDYRRAWLGRDLFKNIEN